MTTERMPEMTTKQELLSLLPEEVARQSHSGCNVLLVKENKRMIQKLAILLGQILCQVINLSL